MTQVVHTDDGIAIEYKVYGSGSHTVLFLHGWGNAASSWDDFITTRVNLADLRCIAASYRGHGGSDLHPRRVLGQVLIAPAGPEKLHVPREAFIPWLEAAPHPQRFREILLPFTKQPIREDLLDLYCRNVSLATRAGLEGTIDMCYESIESEVNDIGTPTLIIAGEGDPLFNPDYINTRVLPTTPGARAVFLPCGHEVPFEMPHETAWLLEAYLAGLLSQASTVFAR